MSLITRALKQWAIYWPPGSLNKYGEATPGDPIALRVRWDDTNEEQVDAKGQTFTTMSSVMVDRDLAVGGLLALSTGTSEETVLQDAATIGDPPVEDDRVHPIRKTSKNPNIKAKEFLRQAFL